MAGLVADYNSESEDENSSDSSAESDNTSNDEQEGNVKIENVQEKLPLPNILSEKPEQFRTEFGPAKIGDGSASVFFNPFKAKENEKLAILERHVKLTERKDETKAEKTKFRRSKNAQKFSKRQKFNNQNKQDDNDDRGVNFKTVEKRKRRVGVNDSLIPPKKALQAYERQRQEEGLK